MYSRSVTLRAAAVHHARWMATGGPRRIIFLGAPGAGKGTFANLLAPLINVPTISTGDVIRKHVKEQTPAGKIMKVRRRGVVAVRVPGAFVCL
jgi:hypothetical protein